MSESLSVLVLVCQLCIVASKIKAVLLMHLSSFMTYDMTVLVLVLVLANRLLTVLVLVLVS